MNKLITAIALTSILALTQACSSLSTISNAEEPKPIATDNHPNANKHGEHPSDRQKTSSETTIAEAKLTTPLNILPNTTVPLLIDVQDLNGKAVEKFEVFQEKLMHLIVVSDDLQFFDHIHPSYQHNGRFKVSANFPQAGKYTLFSDYKPAQSPEQISVLKTQVIGEIPSDKPINFDRTKTFGKTHINLSSSQDHIKASEEVTLTFDLKDPDTNQPITDLQPYLGEKGHLVIIKKSTPLTASDYIHAHALDSSSEGKVTFVTKFAKSGEYKLWGQFNRNGKIVTADFGVHVRD
ncbi:hypothetical protein [Pseudanabaena sp. ABRG5-3]|uniref:hypothetical protein n=1 Tax=Pseudanabaena sp. ABRG5-3 TaxID=685565 RepID=UPI000DC70477|nr:hypothetical protein [Pseudanabaena sp. ABRG5-3]BBC25017.1 hypothetical protein ABRG53_2760 [Pseudanabaena sp. ABRG5-3]